MASRPHRASEPTAMGRALEGAWFGCGLVTASGMAGMLLIGLCLPLLDSVKRSQGGQVAGWVALALVLVAGLPVGALVGSMTLKPARDGALRSLVVVGAALCAGGATGNSPIDPVVPRPFAVLGALCATAALAGAGVLRPRAAARTPPPVDGAP